MGKRAMPPREVARVKGMVKAHMTAMKPHMQTSEAPKASRGGKAAARKVAPRAKARKVGKTKKHPMLEKWMMNWTYILVKSQRKEMRKTARKANHWTAS